LCSLGRSSCCCASSGSARQARHERDGSPLAEPDAVWFGRDRFLFVVTAVYMREAGPRDGSISLMYAEQKGLIANERSRDYARAAADFPQWAAGHAPDHRRAGPWPRGGGGPDPRYRRRRQLRRHLEGPAGHSWTGPGHHTWPGSRRQARSSRWARR
jgi:hypothetical protein